MKVKKAKFRVFFITNRIGSGNVQTEVNKWLNQFSKIDSIVQSVSVVPNPSPHYVGDINLYMTVIYEE